MTTYIDCPMTYAEAALLVQDYLRKHGAIVQVDTVRVKSEQCYEVTFEERFPERKRLVYSAEQGDCTDCWEVKESAG